jgi:GNAT superfamily N-acetyltransferase
MNEEYAIVSVEKPTDPMWEAIGGGLHQFNVQRAGTPRGKSVCLMIYGPNQEIAGGLIGEIHWDWFYVNLMFVKEELRGHGYGHRLLTLAEDEARKFGAKNAYLDTFSFQAPGFYQKHGYQVFGELRDFPPGHQRYYLTKQL